MATYDLGKVVGEAGEKGDDGSSVWNTSTAPTYANSKYTFTISNLSGKTGLQIAVNDIIFYSTYYYIVSTVNTTTVDCTTRVSIKGSDATVTIATSFGSTPSDSKVPSEKLTKNSLDAKADASSLATVATTGDYDDLTDKPTIPSASTTTPSADTSSGSYGSGTSYARSNHTHPKSSLYAEATHNHTKSQITDFPTIPTKTSDLINDGDGSNAFLTQHQSLVDYVQKSSTSGLLKNDGTVDTSSYITSSALSNYVQKSNTTGLLKNDGTVDTTSYSTFSGSYNDLSNKPTIPTKISDLTNDSDFIEKSNTSGLIKNDGSIDTNTYLTQHQSLTDYVQKSNGANTMTDSSAYSTIGTSANATQKTINAAIDSKLDDIYDTFLCENLLFDENDYLGG